MKGLLVSLTFLCISTAVAVPGLAGVEEDERDFESKRQVLDQLEEQVRGLEHDLDAMRGSRAVLASELERSEREIADLARAGRQLTGMIRAQEQNLADLHAQLEREREALVRERVGLAGLIRSAYALGNGDRIRLLLDQEDVAGLGRVMSYYGYLNRYRISRMASVKDRAQRLESIAHAAAEETVRLAQLADRQEETRSRLAETQTQRMALLEELEATISGGEGRVIDLKSEAHGLRNLLDQLERRSRELPEAEFVQEAIGQRKGQLGWPLPAIRLTERFGSPKGDGGQRWDGVLIEAPEGAEVRAVHPGRVVYANWLRGFGLLMIIEHEDGYMTLYGHNQTLLKEAGEWVAAGDPIALSGMSGGLRSGGLYFAIRHRGKPLDPVKWCRAAKAADGAQRTDARAKLSREEPATISPFQLGAGGAPTKVLPRGIAACSTS